MSDRVAAAEARDGQRVLLVSGLSGAGKASILRALEDLGFEAVDNPPLQMLEEMIRPSSEGRDRRIAVGVDARTRGFDSQIVLDALARLRADPSVRAELVFAWADEIVLQRRFTETRRRHPLAETGRVRDGITAERLLTGPLREAADLVIDTSDLPVADLRRLVERRYGMDVTAARLAVSLVSFAFPAGLPRDADMVFDVRFLRNPHYVSSLKLLTGMDHAVGAYIEADPDFLPFFGQVRGMVDFVLPRFVREGKKYCTIAIGCTGGRHRSVYVARLLTDHLRGRDWCVNVMHRELGERDARLGVGLPEPTIPEMPVSETAVPDAAASKPDDPGQGERLAHAGSGGLNPLS